MERGRKGSAAAAGAIRVVNTVGAAMTNHRVLGPAEGGVLLASGLGLLVITALGVVWPRLVAVPITVFTLWLGVALTWRAFRLRTRRQNAPARLSGALPQASALAPAVPSANTVAEAAHDGKETRP